MAAMMAEQQIIGNNLANLNTIGYKQDIPQETEFERILFNALVPRSALGKMSEATGPLVELDESADAAVLAILVIKHEPTLVTANLVGPIVINCRTNKACQLVLDNPETPSIQSGNSYIPRLPNRAANGRERALQARRPAGHQPTARRTEARC